MSQSKTEEPKQHVVLKVQSVQVHDLYVTPEGRDTIGQRIDSILLGYAHDDRHPNKLILDLNPPKEHRPGDMD